MTPITSRVSTLPLAARLRLAFALVAALPLVAVPVVIRTVTASYDRAFARDLDDAAKLLEGELERLSTDVEARTRIVANGPLAEEVARQAADGDGAGLIALAEPALAESGLDVLTIVDEKGRILLSGHLPARLGDIDPAADALFDEKPGKALLASIETRSGDEIVQAQALVAGLRTGSRPPLGVIGGRLFRTAELSRLGELVRGTVTLRDATNADGPPTARGLVRRLFGQARATRDVPLRALGGTKILRVRISDDALVQTKVRIVGGAVVAFVLALLVGVLLAAWLARRTVGPVEALVAGTQRLAKGDWDHRVDVKATGEIAQLVDAFNHMATELSHARDRVAQAERVAAWQQIARALAHEIKNPLTPIAMAVETLQRTHERKHPEFDRFFREGTATVLEEVGRLKRLATEFGELARWPKPVLSPATPAELVRSAASLYSAPPGGVVVETELEGDLPEVSVDRDQFQRCLVNLVKNAFEAMTDGGRVVLRARRIEAGVAFDVADSGKGIDPEARKRLFEPYFTTKAEGTGLGLAIVQRIVTEHGGRIEVDETPGGGTTFRVVLPALP